MTGIATGRSVVVVGGGASAVYAAVALLEQAEERGLPAPEVTVVSRDADVGRGLAYGAADAHHLLNSPAGKMSVSARADADFVEWASARGETVTCTDFVARRLFGDYLVATVEQLVADGRIRVVAGEAVDLRHEDGTSTVVLADGHELAADATVLAVGNPAPATWDSGAPVQIDDPWAPGALDRVRAGSRVLLIGTGLTMVDVATTLARRDPRIRLTATSRHLLLPRIHLLPPPAPVPGIDADASGLDAVMTEFASRFRTAAAAGEPWQPVIDGTRPRFMDLWLGFSPDDRRRFLSHVARRWDVHRHRMAPSVHAELSALLDAGRLDLVADPDTAAFDVAIFCTGPASIARAGWNPLTDALLASGRMVPDDLGLGIRAGTDGAVLDREGASDGSLYALGHALRGALWETTAVGEIRIIANRIASAILDGPVAPPRQPSPSSASAARTPST